MGDFEKYFSKYQTDMLLACHKYANGMEDKIFIYCSVENMEVFCEFFFCIGGHIVRKEALNSVNNGGFTFDTSVERQEAVIYSILENIENIYGLCMNCERPMPTEFKIAYDAKNGKLNADYKYDPLFADGSSGTSSDLAEKWFQETKNQ